MLTFLDLLDHCQTYSGKDVTEAASANFRRAVLAAYRQLPQMHNWLYYWAVQIINTSGSYSTGTVAYDHTGGANERQLTLTDGTWPTWAGTGVVRINNVPYEVESRVSSTILKLTSTSNPGDDIASGTSYEIFRDSYALPDGFLVGDELVTNESGTVLNYVHPRDWSSGRRVNEGPGSPVVYTFVGDPQNPGQKLLKLWPGPDNNYGLSLLYKRAARRLVIANVNAGYVTVAEDSTTVTGTDTAFTSSMVGSVIRFADDSVTDPTGLYGNSPYAFERRITAVASATSLTVNEAIPDALASVKYVISDPADVDEDVHLVLLQREIERQWRQISRTKELESEVREHKAALTQAMENNSAHSGRRAAMRYQTRPSGLKYHPAGADVG